MVNILSNKKLLAITGYVEFAEIFKDWNKRGEKLKKTRKKFEKKIKQVKTI